MTQSIEPVQRASDDRRLSDIQDSVHEIRNDVRGIEKRWERSEQRISEVERQVIENAASQRALEQVMNAENQRLTDKIDTVNGSVERVGVALRDHAEEQTNDFKGAMKVVISMLVTILGTLGWFVFTKVNGGS